MLARILRAGSRGSVSAFSTLSGDSLGFSLLRHACTRFETEGKARKMGADDADSPTVIKEEDKTPEGFRFLKVRGTQTLTRMARRRGAKYADSSADVVNASFSNPFHQPL